MYPCNLGIAQMACKPVTVQESLKAQLKLL